MQTTLKQTEHSNTQSSVELRSIWPDSLETVWDDVTPFLMDALRYGDGKYSLQDIKKEIEIGRMQLFVAIDKEIIATAVTQFSEYPQMKVLTIILVGGTRMDEWLHLMHEFEAWARDEGCEQIEIYGRPGWERVLGWEKTYVALKKGLNEVTH